MAGETIHQSTEYDSQEDPPAELIAEVFTDLWFITGDPDFAGLIPRTGTDIQIDNATRPPPQRPK